MCSEVNRLQLMGVYAFKGKEKSEIFVRQGKREGTRSMGNQTVMSD